MSPELFQQYCEARESGDEPRAKRLRDALVAENMPLVAKIVATMRRRAADESGAEFDDYMQAGAIALMTAIGKFNPGKGKFSVYLRHWVRHEVQRMTHSQETLARPRNATMPRAFRAREEAFKKEHGREATAQELGVRPAVLALWRETAPVIVRPDDDRPVGYTEVEQRGRDGQIPDSKPIAESLMGEAQEDRANMERLHALMQTVLTESQRRVFQGLILEEKSCRELAAELGTNAGLIRKLKASALHKIRAAWTSNLCR